MRGERDLEKIEKHRLSIQPLRRLAVGLVLAYVALAILFYFLAGEQLHLRESRGNVAVLPAEAGTAVCCEDPAAGEHQRPVGNLLPAQCGDGYDGAVGAAGWKPAPVSEL